MQNCSCCELPIARATVVTIDGVAIERIDCPACDRLCCPGCGYTLEPAAFTCPRCCRDVRLTAPADPKS